MMSIQSPARMSSLQPTLENDSVESPQKRLTRWFGPLNFPFAHILPDAFRVKSLRDLARCGYSDPIAYENYLALRNVLVLGVIAVVIAWIIALDDQPQIVAWLVGGGLVLVFVLFAIPRVMIGLWGERRLHRIMHGLPDAFDMIAMSLSGGVTQLSAFDNVSEALSEAHRSSHRNLR